MIRKIKHYGILFWAGGIAYGILEVIYRGYTHWTMILTGGTCCLTLFKFFTKMDPCSMLKKCVIGSVIITVIEFICGCIVNIKFKMNVWDYSHRKCNLLGQICLFHTILWGLLCLPVCFVSKKIAPHFAKF